MKSVLRLTGRELLEGRWNRKRDKPQYCITKIAINSKWCIFNLDTIVKSAFQDITLGEFNGEGQLASLSTQWKTHTIRNHKEPVTNTISTRAKRVKNSTMVLPG
jgi:hypothetical protein